MSLKAAILLQTKYLFDLMTTHLTKQPIASKKNTGLIFNKQHHTGVTSCFCAM